MRIPPKHYDTLKAACLEVIAKTPGMSLDNYESQGLSPMRFNFDVLYRATVNGERAWKWVCDTLYPLGMNDDHIGTALKRILNNNGKSTKQIAKETK